MEFLRKFDPEIGDAVLAEFNRQPSSLSLPKTL